MRRFLAISILLLILSVFPPVASAQGPESEGVQVHFGGNLTLEDGDSIEGGAIVFGGNFTMKEGSEVEGDVVVFGGNVQIDGEVAGNVATLGGNVQVRGNAVIDGDVTSVGGTVSVSPEADVSGVIADGLEVEFNKRGIVIPTIPEIPEIPPTPESKIPVRPEKTGSGLAGRIGHFVGDGVQDIFLALIVAGLSVLLILFFPANAGEIQNTLNRAAPVSFVVGIVTLLATIAVMGLLGLFFWLIIPICGIFLVALAIGLGFLGGWAVIGKYLGGEVFAAFDSPARSEISATFLGVALLTLLATMPFVDNLPLIGWMFSLTSFLVIVVAGSTGLGAVVLSRFGTQEYYPGLNLSPAAVSPAAAEVDIIEIDSEIED